MVVAARPDRKGAGGRLGGGSASPLSDPRVPATDNPLMALSKRVAEACMAVAATPREEEDG
jgi:hypothetical protein